jgi:hypothetical protein
MKPKTWNLQLYCSGIQGSHKGEDKKGTTILPELFYNSPLFFHENSLILQGDSKLLSGIPWPIIFKMKEQNKTANGT